MHGRKWKSNIKSPVEMERSCVAQMNKKENGLIQMVILQLVLESPFMVVMAWQRRSIREEEGLRETGRESWRRIVEATMEYEGGSEE
jgi:hypothetical protein